MKPPLERYPKHQRPAAERLLSSGIVVERPWHHALRAAEGDVELFVHFGGGPWDHVALIPIVEEAGGQFSDLLGDRSLETRTGLFTNGAVHDAALDLLRA